MPGFLAGKHSNLAGTRRPPSIFTSDIVIVRYPAADVGRFFELARLADFEPIYADTLVHWRAALASGRGPERPAGLGARAVSRDETAALVRAVFADYPNHYAANPLLDRHAALEGYVEWATTLLDRGDAASLALVDDAGRDLAFALVDYGPEVADIRLAGVRPEDRGRGHYRALVAAVMQDAVARGRDAIEISTQAHNVAVMSTWARLGWVPTRAVTTVHLVRRGLLR